MKTRIEIDRKNISKSDTELRNELISKGYSVLRKSKSTVIFVLYGREKTEDEINAEKEAEIKKQTFISEDLKKEAEFKAKAKAQVKKMAAELVTVANLWKNFNRRPGAFKNIKGDSFYFHTKSGKKVRVSDHECFHFQLESEKSSWSRADQFEAPDFNFIISEMKEMSRFQAVNFINKTIKENEIH